ncbi:hypothetical protein [Paenibacillus xylanexedens]|uniref:hypothetical protein n=1 Tax=Paenibacillus xylanexedens TaxID=528191 RepID=UPI000F5354D8|nr:hypothetical protein [Paenibacillus xylanexedens]RPK20135.1 hypothetical protein EDO6_06674 [Paenibacillus xylanexedens]
MPRNRIEQVVDAELTVEPFDGIMDGMIFESVSPSEDEENEDFSEEEGVAPSDFPSYQFESKWEAVERESVVNAFFREMEHRLKWIFYRQEKEGVSRTRFINPFSPEDFDCRVEKASAPHRLNTETSTFYDWNIGGTDFIMRLEKLTIKKTICLRCHFIHKTTKKEICVQDRAYIEGVFREINMNWAKSDS